MTVVGASVQLRHVWTVQHATATLNMTKLDSSQISNIILLMFWTLMKSYDDLITVLSLIVTNQKL